MHNWISGELSIDRHIVYLSLLLFITARVLLFWNVFHLVLCATYFMAVKISHSLFLHCAYIKYYGALTQHLFTQTHCILAERVKIFCSQFKWLEHVKQVSIEIRSHELIIFFDCQPFRATFSPLKQFQKNARQFSHTMHVYAKIKC